MAESKSACTSATTVNGQAQTGSDDTTSPRASQPVTATAVKLAAKTEKVSLIEVGADSQVGPACFDTRKVWIKIHDHRITQCDDYHTG